jgi:glutathionylspermidine synthase
MNTTVVIVGYLIEIAIMIVDIHYLIEFKKLDNHEKELHRIEMEAIRKRIEEDSTLSEVDVPESVERFIDEYLAESAKELTGRLNKNIGW